MARVSPSARVAIRRVWPDRHRKEPGQVSTTAGGLSPDTIRGNLGL
ncbi:MAG: hypothetical protein KDA71_19685 [Planctomycetales bacterium]|nr:hypothetical protein [Planctomycetales bacterium]